MRQKRLGRQTVKLEHPVAVLSFASVGGKDEGAGPLREYFDELSDDSFFGEKTWEKAESAMQKRALRRALSAAGLQAEDVDRIYAGDLLNQCIASAFGLREFGIPLYGVYGACSTMGETLSLAAMAIDGGFAERCAAVTSSHFCTAERQYRMPVPYGSQRSPTAQWTATAAGCTILTADRSISADSDIPADQGGAADSGGEDKNGVFRKRAVSGPWITHITCGKIVDKGIKDATNMGAAMAPAAYDTLRAFFWETQTRPEDYDRIITGDLGELGGGIVRDFFRRDGIELGDRYTDCGLLLYDREKQDMHMGGSGCGCSASVLNGYLFSQLRRGIWRRIVFAPTGALLSPTSSFQGESVPGICHALCLVSTRDW